MLVGIQPFMRACAIQWSIVAGSLSGPRTSPKRVSGTGPGTLLERPREDRIVRRPGRREQHRLEPGGDRVVERGLIAGRVDAVHRRPVGARALHPYRRIALVAPRPVDAQARHPPTLRVQIIEVRLMIGARAVVVGHEIHANSTYAK